MLFLCFFCAHSNAQEDRWHTGIEMRAYPAGVVPGAVLGYQVSSQAELTFTIGANFTNRRDWGEHENEEGSGFGGGLRYTHFFKAVSSGWFAGLVTDLWRLEIDWDDDNETRSGMSNITVLQPTGRGGYRFNLNETLTLDTSVALGAEINIATDGEDVGQGAILLLGVQLSF
ncbi:MAG: hypothetical protein AAFP70_03660 [Calditrichota bacterium]